MHCGHDPFFSLLICTLVTAFGSTQAGRSRLCGHSACALDAAQDLPISAFGGSTWVTKVPCGLICLFQTAEPLSFKKVPHKAWHCLGVANDRCITAYYLSPSMRLILITQPDTAAVEHSAVNQLFGAGLEVLHVRKPSYSRHLVAEYLRKVEPQWRHRIVLHQHHDLAAEFGLKVGCSWVTHFCSYTTPGRSSGSRQLFNIATAYCWLTAPETQKFYAQGIHYKERDRPPPPIGRAYPALSQSSSLHTLEDLVRDWQNLDYAFLSPIFDSISKDGYTAADFPRKEVMAALQQAQMPVYALGGITPDRLQQVQELGFAGVGVLGAVWGADDPVAALEAFQDQL